jgi:hypothetical protein
MRRRKTSSDSGYGLSFLDCICCGFGAIILLFVLTMGSKSQIIEDLRIQLQRLIEQRLAKLAEMRTEEEKLMERIERTSEALRVAELKSTELRSLIDTLLAQIQERQAGREALLVELEQQRKDVAALQKKSPLDVPLPEINAPVGLPIESNYIAFVFDTSGSMRDPNTGRLYDPTLTKIQEVLESYPSIKGMQFLDADGRFLLRSGGGQWLPDDPMLRKNVIEALARYPIFSNSNPVPGIIRAIRSLHQPANEEMRMSVFIFGDEFTGTAEPVLAQLETINPRDENGKRRVTINAVGFPTVLRYGLASDHTGMKYANLMRELTYRHDGAFIAVR